MVPISMRDTIAGTLEYRHLWRECGHALVLLMSCVCLFAVFVCLPCFTHNRGIAWAPACGLAMSELILDGESSTIDLRPFDPCRFTPSLRGSRGRKRRGASVGEQW